MRICCNLLQLLHRNIINRIIGSNQKPGAGISETVPSGPSRFSNEHATVLMPSHRDFGRVSLTMIHAVLGCMSVQTAASERDRAVLWGQRCQRSAVCVRYTGQQAASFSRVTWLEHPLRSMHSCVSYRLCMSRELPLDSVTMSVCIAKWMHPFLVST